MIDSINPVTAIVSSQLEFRWSDFAILFGSAIGIVVVMLLVGWLLVGRDGFPIGTSRPRGSSPAAARTTATGRPPFWPFDW
jgi:hypothetical protein